uniref:Lipocalin n=1 Tax=Rhipicephalus zambeziensis TaxID=60191 RepID=A0A224YMN3_9ACAR
MAQLSISCAVAFVLLMKTVPPGAVAESHQEDIVQFWNTSELIWTTNTTAEDRRVCKVDMKQNISEKNIIFKRSYLTQAGWIIREYHGVFRNFLNDDNYQMTSFNAVDIGKKRGHDNATEILYYQSSDNKCAVFLVLGVDYFSRLPWYEIRMTDTYIKQGFRMQDECWKQFEEATKGRRRRRAYDSRCQDALKKRFPSPIP